MPGKERNIFVHSYQNKYKMMNAKMRTSNKWMTIAKHYWSGCTIHINVHLFEQLSICLGVTFKQINAFQMAVDAIYVKCVYQR